MIPNLMVYEALVEVENIKSDIHNTTTKDLALIMAINKISSKSIATSMREEADKNLKLVHNR